MLRGLLAVGRRHNQLRGSTQALGYEGFSAAQKRALFRSRERGMLETDLILGTFAEKNLHKYSGDDLKRYEEILDEIDGDLFDWWTGKAEMPAKYKDCNIMDALVKHTWFSE